MNMPIMTLLNPMSTARQATTTTMVSLSQRNRQFFCHVSFSQRKFLVRKEDIDWQERQLILEDARSLKTIAEYYLHPEKPVLSEGGSRCYFDRASAPVQLSKEDADERALILEETRLLKETAVHFLHPENPVVTTDPLASGRNFFSRHTAISVEDEEYRLAALEDAKKLKSLALDFMHPEIPVRSSIGVSRCYFDRPSAPRVDYIEDQADILQDVALLKKAARDYMHPELPVAVTDPTACARCFFDRASAPVEDPDWCDEREDVLQDAADLKRLAGDYLHPEKPLHVDPTAMARCYYDRASAPHQEDILETIEKQVILEDCKMLKSLAVDYLHPEKPVLSNGPTARCFFDRASADQATDPEFENERLQVLEDMACLKKYAVHYLHPELPVAVDAAVTARCFFDRPSAATDSLAEFEEERTLILEEARALKQNAVHFLHPELPVVTANPTATARCYFDRYSAPEQESLEMSEERTKILEDSVALKTSAKDYMHPELPVVADPELSARCYFERFSAESFHSKEESLYRGIESTSCQLERNFSRYWAF